MRQDLHDDPIELLLTLVSTMRIIASASLQSRVKTEPACPTEETPPEVRPQDMAPQDVAYLAKAAEVLLRGGRT